MTTLKETKIARRSRELCPTIDCGEGLTEQAHKDQCDINMILADYQRTGFIRHAREHQGQYDDVTAVDFQDAMVTVANVKSMFEGLPSKVRKEFHHDPTNFLLYVQEPSNAAKLEQRGILVGNDGIDISGAYSGAPTKTSVKKSADSSGESAGTAISSGETQASESATG